MYRREEFHYSRVQVVGHLDDARAIVEELGLPDDLRPVAFRKAVELLSGKQIMFEDVRPPPLLAPHLGRNAH